MDVLLGVGDILYFDDFIWKHKNMDISAKKENR